MTVMDDGELLLAAILLNPDEDVPRLAYADHIEDRDPARAELIRVQCELERTRFLPLAGPAFGTIDLDHISAGRDVPLRSLKANRNKLRARADALVAENADRWRRSDVRCDHCGGRAWMTVSVANTKEVRCADCPACLGTGEAGGLRKKRQHSLGRVVYAVRGEYVRGMLRLSRALSDVCERVVANTHGGMDEVFWRQTPWSKAVLAAHPDVTELWADREPRKAGFGDVWGWCRQSADHRDGYVNSQVPDPVWETLPVVYEKERGSTWRWFPTADAAKVALARALPRWVRALSEVRT